MKVLIIHTKYTQAGGEDSVVLNEYNLLKNNGVTCKVAYFENNGSSVIQLLKFILYPFNIFSYVKTRRIIREFKPDIVHIHNFFYTASPSIFYALKHKKVPFVITLHNFRLICPSGTLFFKNKLYLKSLQSKFTLQPAFDKVYRNSFFLTFWLSISNYFHYLIGTWRLPSGYIFISKFSQSIFAKSRFGIYKDKFELKYNFMPSTHGNVYSRTSDFVYVGRLSEEKGIRILLEAFSKLPYNILIIGDGDLKEEVLKYSELFTNIKFLGFKKREELLNDLRKCKALIFPSIWYEGMPLTIIEAFSVGTPVISSDLGAMSEMIVDNVNGVHFKQGETADLIEKVNYLVSLSEDKYQKLIKSTMEDFKDRFTEAESFKKILNVYSDIINN